MIKMTSSKILKKYKKPLVTEHGNIKHITKGSWKGEGDGIPERGDS
ncbi:lasso RiPP family leader peptide-containing protein [Methanobacterium movens]